MKESVNIAYTFVRHFSSVQYPSNNYFSSHGIHIHCPEGSVEKEGPSAGIAMATALFRYLIYEIEIYVLF